MNDGPATQATDVGPAPVRPSLLHEFFREAVRRWPDRVAVEVPPGHARPERSTTTYAQLDRAADALARQLHPRVTGECVVGILLPRDSPRLYAAQLAVLRTGAAYTCIDPAFPDERVRDLLTDAEAVALLTDAAGHERVRRAALSGALVIDTESTDDGAPLPRTRPETTGPSWLTPRNLAYVIYTSGTTGRPKGVMIEHRSIANLVAGDLDGFELTPEDRVAQNSSAAYDSSLEEIWLAFAAGATLVVMDEEAVRLGPDLVEWLRNERITVFCPPPTLLRATGCDDPQAALPDLRFVYLGGEALPGDLADRWSRGRLLVNGYGPTECSVTCLREALKEGDPVTIGRPIPGLSAWVLDETLGEVRPDEPGELHIGGVGLARGYWRRPEITAERFIEHPRLGRLYRTGDLAHRDSDGRFHYHGRIDAQVKLRGYRIELGEIEARLAGLPGVRAAACHVQDDHDQPELVAFVVPADTARPPTGEELRRGLATVLPDYMVPARFGHLAELPTTIGGKLNRPALPRLDGIAPGPATGDRAAPRTPLESIIATAFAEILPCPAGVSIHDDFFHGLGGDSLRAARLVTRLRGNAATAWVTVRDVYESRTAARLAERAPAEDRTDEPVAGSRSAPGSRGHPRLVTLAQTLWLLLVLLVGSAIGGWLTFEVLPRLADALGLIPLILLAPLLGILLLVLWTPGALLMAVALKRLLIGTYRPLRAPAWGGFHLRNWIVQQGVRLVPWRLLQGTVFQHAALRALGARIGRRVHIHRGVDLLRGGWDLLDLGDDVSLGQDAAIRLVEFECGEIVVAPVTLGDGATLETRAGVAGDTRLEPMATLTALSSLPAGGRIPRGERWDGIPAAPAGRSAPLPEAPPGPLLKPWSHGLLLLAARGLLGLVLALPAELLTIAVCRYGGLDAARLGAWLVRPAAGTTAGLGFAALVILILIAALPLTLAWTAVLLRLLGPVRAGVMSRWSPGYVRVWLKPGLIDRASEWLCGTLFWPVWLRIAGMTIGPGCEISTIIDTLPELLDIGSETFFADGIYLGGPLISRGIVTLARTSLGRNTFLGNHAVIAAGQRLPGDLLLGVSTAADDRLMRPGTSWFGHPPFELPRREVVEADRRLTHEPSAIRYGNRVFWELLRFALPIVPALVFAGWARALAAVGTGLTRFRFLTLAVPLATLGAGAVLVLFVLGLKWLLLGRVRPGHHPLWSCWCSRWDFLYVAWGQLGRPVLERLEGTLLLNVVLRAMGMRIGRRVLLGPGFSQVVDPDMLALEDDTTVNAMFQAHTFEDRVLKIDRVIVRRGASLGGATVPLYGADIGEGTDVGHHSVIMKQERLLPGRRYEGTPSRAGGRKRAA